eukprot:4416143-Amphidinium_carterae.1
MQVADPSEYRSLLRVVLLSSAPWDVSRALLQPRARHVQRPTQLSDVDGQMSLLYAHVGAGGLALLVIDIR